MTSVTRSPETIINDNSFGDVEWINLDNVKISDSSYTTTTLSSQTSNKIKSTNFGFSIPTGSTINGIKVEYQIKTSIGIIGNFATNIVKNNVAVGSGYSFVGGIDTTESYKILGDSGTFLWEQSWTADDINSNGFGVQSYVYSNETDTISINHIRITVYYTEPPTTTGVSTMTGVQSITF